jgi:hypothetical protein
MNAVKLFVVAILPMATALGADATAKAVAALRENLGSGVDLAVDEVRLTDAGIACINFHVGSDQNRDHAVVHGDEVLKGSTDEKRFDDAWSEHCLGPRGGVTSGGGD